MPEMDGIQAMQTIKNINERKNIQIIALTAQAMQGERERLLNLGFDEYLAKPFNEDYFLAFLESYFLKKMI